MAAPIYSTDLILINACDSTTGWAEWTGWIGGGAQTAETDYFIEGAGCISQQLKSGIGSLGYDFGANITFASGDVFLAWMYSQCPNALDTQANGGQRLVMGTTIASYKAWYVGGRDYYTYGGWRCVPVDPTVTADFTTATPPTTWRFFGSANNVSGSIGKGNPHGVDIMRKGRAKSAFTAGDSTTPATFTGFGTLNDTNRWGLIQPIDGGYLFQGLMSMGTGTTAVYFVDSNKNISINAPLKVTSTFNRIEIRVATSRVDWTAINISSLGTLSRGQFECIDNATVNFNTCVFTDMSTFIFKSLSTILNTTFRRCDIVTQSGATFTNCTFAASRGTKALLSNNVSLVTKTSFTSSGTGYAIEGFSTAGEYSFNGLTFAGYAAANGSTGNEAIHVLATTGIVNLNISGGGSSTFSIHTAGATVNIVAGTVTVSVTVKTTNNVPINAARVLLLANSGGSLPYNATVTITNSSTTATVTHTAHGMLTNDKVQIVGASHIQNNGVFQITKINDNSYSYTMTSAPGSNPTGTIKATYAALEGLTDTNGIISTTRVFSNQPVYGRARKSSGTPLYKTTDINDTISAANGLALNVALILDE